MHAWILGMLLLAGWMNLNLIVRGPVTSTPHGTGQVKVMDGGVGVPPKP